MKIDYCLHTHTKRCGHAQGEDEEYVISAINGGLKILGFSDHIMFPDFSEPKIRGEYSELGEYMASINSLKEKYKDKIKILLGFECEYFDEYLSFYKHLYDIGFEYLIFGQHFVMENHIPYYYEVYPKPIYRKKYVIEAEKALKTQLFLYFAHPDYILWTYKRWCKSAKEISYQICRMAKKYNVPIEINVNGIKYGNNNPMHYPVNKFWEIASEIGNEVVIGYDAHNPNYFTETKYINKAIELANKYNLNLLNIEDLLKRRRNS